MIRHRQLERHHSRRRRCSSARRRHCPREAQEQRQQPGRDGRVVDRYYDPATGQFLTVDPLVAQTEQPYVYAGDDPVNGSDPSGEWAVVAPIAETFTPAEAEAWVYKQFVSARQQVTFDTAIYGSNRRIDVYNNSEGGVLNEVKTGTQSNNADLRLQINKDGLLLHQGYGLQVPPTDPPTLPISGDTWWFLPNEQEVTAPSRPLLQNLLSRGINIIYLFYWEDADDDIFGESFGAAADDSSSAPITAAVEQQSNAEVSAANSLNCNASSLGLDAAASAVEGAAKAILAGLGA